ncbi:MAG: aldose 1-epimerase, partial [Neolewinella sp.]
MSETSTKPWGKTPQGEAQQFILTNTHGNTVTLSNYGATITSLKINGKEMVLGFNNLTGYLS